MRASVGTAARWARAHPALVSLSAYVVLAAIFFWPGLLPGHTVSGSDYLWSAAPWNTTVPAGVPLQSLHPLIVGSNPQIVDGVTVFQPLLQYTATQLPHIPLWDPYIMGGMPLLADMQSAIFSPFSLPAYIFPFWWSLGFIALCKVVVAALGAYLLGRSLKMGPIGAFLCGLVFGFGLFMVAWIPWPLTNVFPLIPWLLLVVERLIRRPNLLWGTALAALVALQFFGGEPESSVYALFATIGFFLLRMLQEPGGGARAIAEAARQGRSRLAALFTVARRPVATLVAALAVGTALAAVTILPFAQLVANSSDLKVRPRSGVHVPPQYVFAAFLPRYFPGGFEIETAFYIGALPLMLAFIAIFRPRTERVAIAVVGILALAVTLGIQPFFVIAGHIPGLDDTYLSRLTIIYLLCMALLAGWGLDDIVRGRVRGRRAWAGGAIAAALLLLPFIVVLATSSTSIRFLHRALRIAWLFAPVPGPTNAHVDAIVRLTALVVWLTVALIAVILLCLVLTRRMGPKVFAALAIALTVGDLFQAGMGYNPAITQAHAVQPTTPAITYLQHQRPARYVAVTAPDEVTPLPPDVNIRYGLFDLRGYDLPVITRFGNLWVRYIAPPTPLLPLDTPAVPLSPSDDLSPATLRILSLYGVKDILEDKRGPVLHIPGLRLVYDDYDGRIYENEHVLPRTWLVANQDVVASPDRELSAIGAPGFDPRTTLIASRRLPSLRPSGAGGVPRVTSPGVAHITHYGAQQVRITARATRASELILSDTYYPGWHVSVNGRTEPISEVDYLLRGVAVPAGVDHIVFTYDPATFQVGWIVSLVSALAVISALLVTLRRRRDAPRKPAQRGRAEHATRPGRPRLFGQTKHRTNTTYISGA